MAEIPKSWVCDLMGCGKVAQFRVMHDHISGENHYREVRPIIFEFCEDHASEFTITGRGAWTVKQPLKIGSPRG